ncbi:LacI family DNA-binding transcriptional regulator [Photobacterium swingsii]|uniref:LacI family DNA-binding transcriptional regulator n=1 Tax=Photobacterium swingsii TaxID=680026 RepID=UPI00406811F8
MARIKDVALLAGVNRSTVSRIINGEGKFRADTKRKVEQAMAELNYRPSAIARSLATASSNMVGLLVTYYTGGFFGEMMDQVQSELDCHGKFLITAQGHHSAEGEREAIQRFFDLRCDGYILHSRHLSDAELRELAKQPTPFVLLDRLVKGLEDRCITFDHTLAAQLAVNHLIVQGHRKIACISGALNRETSRQRFQGYKNALAAAGLPFDPSLTGEGDYGRESGYQAAQKLLQQHEDMEALFSCSEEMMSGALQFFHQHKIAVPEQLSVTSFDSVDLCASFYPTVTAVHFPISDMARTAVEVLHHLLNKQETDIERHFLPHLLSRQSVLPR